MQTLVIPKTPKTIKVLIYSNIALYLVAFIATKFDVDLYNLLGAVPFLIIKKYYVWQLITYMFLHAGIFHLLFNTLMLWMLGTELASLWGRSFFIKYYFLCGLGAGICVVALSLLDQRMYMVPTIGSSGAIFGLLLAYGINFKNRILYIFGLIPVKASILVLILGAVELLSLFSESNSSISHIAHLGGLLTGLLYLKIKDIEKKLLAKKYLKLKDKRHLHIVDIDKDGPQDPKLWN